MASTPARNRAALCGGREKRNNCSRFPVGSAALACLTCHISSPAERRLQLRSVNYDNFSGIGPVVCIFHQSCANWVLPDITPFLGITFIGAQKMIEKAALPDYQCSSRLLDLLREILFQHSDPSPQPKIVWATDEKVQMIRHDNVSADGNVVRRICVSRERDKCGVHGVRCQ